MIPLQLRLACFFHPKVLATTLIVAASGYFAILFFGISQTASLHLNSPYLAPIEAAIRQIFTERYSAIALGWIGSAIGFAWLFASKQANKALRIIDRY